MSPGGLLVPSSGLILSLVLEPVLYKLVKWAGLILAAPVTLSKKIIIIFVHLSLLNKGHAANLEPILISTFTPFAETAVSMPHN